ncbi:MAG: glycerol-3-phosphate acyltransferase [Dehalococcoidia bacterium]
MDSLLAQLVLAVAAGYLLGAIPSAYLAGRFLKNLDIRLLGDGNVGAENAYAELGPKTGVGVVIADIGKGALAVGTVQASGFAEGAVLAAGVAAVAGHTWPVYLHFKGGRGAATTIGVLLVALFPASIVPSLLGLLLAVARKGTTVACAAIFIGLQPFVWLIGYPVFVSLFALGLPVLVGVIHFYSVVLPEYQRTGRLHLRPKE